MTGIFSRGSVAQRLVSNWSLTSNDFGRRAAIFNWGVNNKLQDLCLKKKYCSINPNPDRS